MKPEQRQKEEVNPHWKKNSQNTAAKLRLLTTVCQSDWSELTFYLLQFHLKVHRREMMRLRSKKLTHSLCAQASVTRRKRVKKRKRKTEREGRGEK